MHLAESRSSYRGRLHRCHTILCGSDSTIELHLLIFVAAEKHRVDFRSEQTDQQETAVDKVRKAEQNILCSGRATREHRRYKGRPEKRAARGTRKNTLRVVKVVRQKLASETTTATTQHNYRSNCQLPSARSTCSVLIAVTLSSCADNRRRRRRLTLNARGRTADYQREVECRGSQKLGVIWSQYVSTKGFRGFGMTLMTLLELSSMRAVVSTTCRREIIFVQMVRHW